MATSISKLITFFEGLSQPSNTDEINTIIKVFKICFESTDTTNQDDPDAINLPEIPGDASTEDVKKVSQAIDSVLQKKEQEIQIKDKMNTEIKKTSDDMQKVATDIKNKSAQNQAQK